MQLFLQGLVPLPLREKVSARKSDIWSCELRFNSGDRLFVKAPSGTGKTTLIHILYGLRADYEGSVLWGNEQLSKANPEVVSQLRKNDVSIVFQDMRLLPELTLGENLELKRQLTGTVSELQLTDWLSRLGIADKKNALANTLSYGEQQRAAIIRALLQPFKWLLMDKPFSHLDKANIEKAIALIKEIVDNNNAGMLLADLDDNTYFPYSQTLIL